MSGRSGTDRDFEVRGRAAIAAGSGQGVGRVAASTAAVAAARDASGRLVALPGRPGAVGGARSEARS